MVYNLELDIIMKVLNAAPQRVGETFEMGSLELCLILALEIYYNFKKYLGIPDIVGILVHSILLKSHESYRKLGAGYPWAGQTMDTEVFSSITVGFPLTTDIFGGVVDMGSKERFSCIMYFVFK